MIVKKLTQNEFHPFSRLPFSPLNSSQSSTTFDALIQKFYDKYYKLGSLTVSVVCNKGNSTSVDAAAWGIDKILSDVPREGVVSEGKTDYVHSSLPFRGLPRLIAFRNKERDSIRVTYQVQTSFSEEAEHEGVKYTCYVLLTVLRDKLHESETVHHVRVYAEYFSHFALISVDAHMSEKGLESPDKIIGIVLAAVEEVKRHNEEETYLRAKDKTFVIYNTEPVMSSKRLSGEFARQTPKYGFENSFRATKTLNRYSRSSIDGIFSQLKFDNMLIVFGGDFSISNDTSTKMNIKEVLSKRITRSASFEAPLAGSIVLNRHFGDINQHYMNQYIDEYSLDNFLRLAKDVRFGADLKNPYETSEKFLEVLKENKYYKMAGSRSSFHKTDNKVSDSHPGFYFRVNQLFPLPTTFINMRFVLPMEGNVMSLSDVYEHHVRTLVLYHTWMRRLSLIRGYVEEYNGKVMVELTSNVVSVTVYCSNEHAGRVVDRVLDKIDVMTQAVTGHEYVQSLYRIYRELQFDTTSFDQMQYDFEMMVTKFSISGREVIKYIEENHSKINRFKENPTLVFGLIEGDVQVNETKEYLGKIQKRFKSSAAEGFKHLSLKNFDQYEMRIFRFDNLQKRDKRAMYMMGIDLGRISLTTYSLAVMYGVLFEREMKLVFVKRLRIADRVRVRVARISDHIVLELMTMGMTSINETEVQMEKFLVRSRTLFESEIDGNFMKRWKEIAISRLRVEKESVFDYAYEDANDLFLSMGRFEGIRARAIETLKDHITPEDARTFINQHIIKGKRVVYEQYLNVTEATPISLESPDPDLRTRTKVHLILNNVA